MEITIPKIRLPLNLGEYSSENEGQLIYVWVNPPRRLKSDYFRSAFLLGDGSNPGALARDNPADPASWSWLTRVRKNRKRTTLSSAIVRWYAQIWSFTENGEDLDKSKVVEFAENLQELDPAMWIFLTTKSWIMIQQFLETAKKVPTTLS